MGLSVRIMGHVLRVSTLWNDLVMQVATFGAAAVIVSAIPLAAATADHATSGAVSVAGQVAAVQTVVPEVERRVNETHIGPLRPVDVLGTSHLDAHLAKAVDMAMRRADVTHVKVLLPYQAPLCVGAVNVGHCKSP